MISSRMYRISVPLMILIAAIALMVFGGFAHSYKVYEELPQDLDDPFLLFEKIDDPSMVIECTITGVARTDAGLFYFTYDRSAPPKACPT